MLTRHPDSARGNDLYKTPEVASLALQHHVEIETLRHAVTRDARGEAASLVGAVVDALIVRGAA
jgi:hypothetical protein